MIALRMMLVVAGGLVGVILMVICIGLVMNSFGSLLNAAHFVAWTTKQNIIFLCLNSSRSQFAIPHLILGRTMDDFQEWRLKT